MLGAAAQKGHERCVMRLRIVRGMRFWIVLEVFSGSVCIVVDAVCNTCHIYVKSFVFDCLCVAGGQNFTKAKSSVVDALGV